MRARKFVTGLLAVLVFALAIAPSLVAQSLVSGDLAGTVTDPSGAVVPNATVTLKSDTTGANRTTTTNAAGGYRFALVPPGSYTVLSTPPAGSGFDTITDSIDDNALSATNRRLTFFATTHSPPLPTVTATRPLLMTRRPPPAAS